jgi:hypothetical protein
VISLANSFGLAPCLLDQTLTLAVRPHPHFFQLKKTSISGMRSVLPYFGRLPGRTELKAEGIIGNSPLNLKLAPRRLLAYDAIGVDASSVREKAAGDLHCPGLRRHLQVSTELSSSSKSSETIFSSVKIFLVAR